MRKSYLIMLVVAVGIWTYTYLNRYIPCAEPIPYSVSAFDSRFNISKSDLLTATEQAAGIWNAVLGKKLFEYDAKDVYKKDLAINLVYDSRQQMSQQNSVLKSQINQTEQTADQINQQITVLKSQYQQKEATYEMHVSEYKAAQTAYNSEIAMWNQKGGAPKNEFNQLQQKKVNLALQYQALETERLALNSLLEQINALVDKYNVLIRARNSTADVINKNAGVEFNEGLYSSDAKGQRIDIYEFSSRDVLVRVLAHEFGHALGLDHNNNPASIMYYLNKSQSMKLTAEDRAALKTVCKVK